MRVAFKVLLLSACVVGLLILWSNCKARRPRSMPSTSVWLDAPYVPFGWNRGWWLGCWTDSDGKANRCRMWNAELQSVTFEGRYVPCSGTTPVSESELSLKKPSGAFGTWVLDGHGDLAPAVFLQNGRALIPIDAPAQTCEKLPSKP
jgi:hypothetical protein